MEDGVGELETVMEEESDGVCTDVCASKRREDHDAPDLGALIVDIGVKVTYTSCDCWLGLSFAYNDE